MRCATASEFKKKGRRTAPLQIAPRVGSRLRETYDLLMANKGVPVEIQYRFLGPDMRYLIDFYGLDIRLVKPGHVRSHRLSTYILAGEWFGRVYVDYIAARLTPSDHGEAA